MFLRALGDQADVDAQSCIARGGVPIFRYTHLNADGSPNMATRYYGGCQLPLPAPAAGPVTQNTVTTAVSPQISPGFVQQDHPTDSPVTVSTRQQDAGSATSVPLANSLDSAPVNSPGSTVDSPGSTPAINSPGANSPTQDTTFLDYVKALADSMRAGQNNPAMNPLVIPGGGTTVIPGTPDAAQPFLTPQLAMLLIAGAVGIAFVLKKPATRSQSSRRARKRRYH